MKNLLGSTLAACGLVAGMAMATPVLAQDATCQTERTIDIAEMSWPSAAALAQIHAIIIEEGFGCDAELVTGDTVPTLASMTSRGQPALAPEMWPNASQEAWDAALADGEVVDLAPAVAEGLVQGWYIPTYVAEANPDLTSVEDLADHADLFEDPEDPDKGRFYSCPPGWACEIMNENFFEAYGLGESFNLFSPGSGGALDASISRAFLREEPIVYYYWGPTAMMGRHDMTRLDMAEFDADKFACIGDPECENPEKTDFVVPEARIAASSWLVEEAPAIADYLRGASLTNSEIGRFLDWGEQNRANAADTAVNFIETESDIWTEWVSEDVAARVQESL